MGNTDWGRAVHGYEADVHVPLLVRGPGARGPGNAYPQWDGAHLPELAGAAAPVGPTAILCAVSKDRPETWTAGVCWAVKVRVVPRTKKGPPTIQTQRGLRRKPSNRGVGTGRARGIRASESPTSIPPANRDPLHELARL